MSASSEIAGGKDENDFVDGVEDSQNGVHKKRKQKKHILPNMEQHKYHKLKKKYALLERSMAKLRHHVKKLEKENDKLRANFLDLQQSSAEVIQRKDDRIQELTDQVQQYISRLQTSQLIQHRDQTRRLSHDLGHRGHHSQSPDDRGNLRHAGTRREKRTRGASSERGDSREKRRREDEHHIRHRQTEVVTRQRSRLGDSAGVSSRGHRDHQPYRSSSQHSASPHDKRPSESHTQSPVAAGAPYRSDHDLRTSRVHHNREGDREHGRSRNVSSRSSGKKQGRDSSDSRVNTRDKSLPQEELPVDQPEAAGEVKEGSRQQLGISDQERMRAYISLAQKRTLVQQIAFKNSQKLRNRMIADYTSRSADHADFIASLPKARDKETNADSSDSERSCRSRVSTFDDGNLFADLTAFDDDVVAKSAYTTLVTTQSVSPLGSIETPVKDEHLTNPEPFAERSVNVVNEITGQTDMCMRGRVDTKQDSMSSQEMLITVASADICNSRVDSTGYGNTGAIRTKREVSETNTHNTKVAQDATAPLSMLLSVLFGKAMSSPVSAAGMTRVALTTGESAENTTKECSTLDSLPHTGLTVVRNLQQVPAVTCVPSAIVPPYQARDLKCAGTIQRTDEIVIDISKHNATSVTRNVERSMDDVKMGKTESLDDVKSGKNESLDNVTRNNTKSCNAKPSKTESFGDVTPGKTVSVQNVADTTNDSETNESGIRIVEESANSYISRKDVRHCADPDRGNNSLRSSGKRHTSKHKTSSRTDRNTADCSSSTRTLQSSGRETGERTEENNVVIPTDDPERATFVSDCLTTDSCCSQPDRTVAETCPVKPAETNIDAVFSDDDEDDDASDFAFVIDTNVSPVSSDIDDSSVSRKDEDLWDVSLQSDNKNDRGHSTPAGSQCGEHGELAGRTDGTRSNDGSTVGRTHAVAARADVPKARLHVRDPRRVVKSRDQRRPDSATSRRRSSNDDSKVRSTPCAKSKPSSLVSLSKVELSDGSKKTRRLSDQHRRRQKESRENRRPILQHNRPQKNDTRRQSESRNVEGGTSPTTRKAKCQNGHIAPSASVTKIHGARKEIRPVKSVSAQHDHRTAVSGSDMRAHRARDAVKKPLASDGTPPNKRAPHARADLKNKLLASGGDSSNKTAHRSRDDLTSGGFPPNKSAHEAHDDKKNQHLTTGGTARNKSANRARDELKNHSLTSGGTPPNKSAHHGRYDFKKNCVTSDESAPNKTTPSVRDDFKNALANDESPCTKAVVNDILSIASDKDTPARSENPCVAETRDDSMEEGEILSDEDPGSASDVTVKRRVVDPRSSSDGVHRTHSHGTNRDHVPRRRSLHSTSTKH